MCAYFHHLKTRAKLPDTVVFAYLTDLYNEIGLKRTLGSRIGASLR